MEWVMSVQPRPWPQIPEATAGAQRVRFGMGWKYALGMGLDDPGLDASVLCELRTRVVQHGLEERVLDLLLAALKDKGLVAAGGKQRTGSTHVLAAVRDLNRLELAGASVRACAEALAVAAPGWLAATFEVASWGRRYTARVDAWRLPASKARRAELAVATARTGSRCLGRCTPWLRRSGRGSCPRSRCCGWWCCSTTPGRSPATGGRWSGGGRQTRTASRRAGVA